MPERQEDGSRRKQKIILYIKGWLGQFTRDYTQTVKRAADNKRRYTPGEGSIPPVLLSGESKGACPLAHDFAKQSVVCYTLCRRCRENAVDWLGWLCYLQTRNC